jgi:hypothetical protein
VRFARPIGGDGAGFFEVVDDEDELVIVVAVEGLDVDSGVGHAAGEFAELAGLVLAEAEGDDVALGEDADAGGLEGAAGEVSVMEEKVGDGGGGTGAGSGGNGRTGSNGNTNSKTNTNTKTNGDSGAGEPGAAAFDAGSGTAESFTQFGEGAGAVF